MKVWKALQPAKFKVCKNSQNVISPQNAIPDCENNILDSSPGCWEFVRKYFHGMILNLKGLANLSIILPICLGRQLVPWSRTKLTSSIYTNSVLKLAYTPLLKEVKPDPEKRVSENMLSVHEILSLREPSRSQKKLLENFCWAGHDFG